MIAYLLGAVTTPLLWLLLATASDIKQMRWSTGCLRCHDEIRGPYRWTIRLQQRLHPIRCKRRAHV